MDRVQEVESVDGARPDAQIVAERIQELFAGALRDEAAGWERDAILPRGVFERIAATGAFEARWPEGARDPGNVSVSGVLIREMAWATVGGCIAMGTHTEVFFRALSRSVHGREAWGDALEGRRIGAFAVTEHGGGSTPSNCRTTAVRHGDEWVIEGHKHYVSNAPTATDLILFTRTAEGRDLTNFTVFLVPTDAAGIEIQPHALSGARASGTCMVDLDGVRVDDERRVGAVGGGLVLLLEFLRGERMAAAIGSLATAELCLEIALAWVDSREAGGERLRQKQALAHRLAKLATEVAAARGMLRDLLDKAQIGKMTSADAAAAKFFIGGLAWRAADEAMQMLAGHGYTEETRFAQLWRDVRIGRIGGGTDEVQLEMVAQNMRPSALAGHGLVREIEEAAVRT